MNSKFLVLKKFSIDSLPQPLPDLMKLQHICVVCWHILNNAVAASCHVRSGLPAVAVLPWHVTRA